MIMNYYYPTEFLRVEFMSCDIYVYVLIRGLTLTLRTGQFESGRESPSLRLDALSKAGIWAVRYNSLDLT